MPEKVGRWPGAFWVDSCGGWSPAQHLPLRWPPVVRFFRPIRELVVCFVSFCLVTESCVSQAAL